MKDNLSSPTFLLRVGLAVVLAMHSIPSIFTGAVNDFGKLYLDPLGFAPFGLYIAWAIKLTHLVSVPCLLLDKYMKPLGLLNIGILVVGIIMVHYQEGWFVVGGGRNGVEFNFILIFALLTVMFPQGALKKILA